MFFAESEVFLHYGTWLEVYAALSGCVSDSYHQDFFFTCCTSHDPHITICGQTQYNVRVFRATAKNQDSASFFFFLLTSREAFRLAATIRASSITEESSDFDSTLPSGGSTPACS